MSQTDASASSKATASADTAAPDYWTAACDHLMKKDRVMRRLVPKFIGASIETRGEPFVTLARSVVGQQISVKAAQSVWDRFSALMKTVNPRAVSKLTVEDMRAAGLSGRKVEYIKDLADYFQTGKVSVKQWDAMEDEAIIAELIAIRGIGRWTAEMFLMFYLRRPDVLPLDDVGLLNGISKLYFSDEPVSRSEVRDLARAWEPYRSVATWYIWRSLDPDPVAY
ncbi:MAG: DNA-3-methyladenine glycosylase [Burkholderiaceae bacterium]|jgi:DNA-3-methyladenine glycosylase II|nr:DNA-3-methyladenine glycosylase [Betaproteobacteria bacterium]MDA9885405.1 DNA-3-methyladenine glycosylase [Burkholderiaceae bacterium]MDB0048091.1 DNA-3-methyladenine glycosylase [Burkholderiaceae bacterium]MDC1457984.1 DNA-3-methyladenine glycosylase [Burkholderiaceae bacterium]MDG1107046.1 DNA-3-methyladenine glycosylase [Burkholderiaceae bacterium]